MKFILEVVSMDSTSPQAVQTGKNVIQITYCIIFYRL